MIEDLLSSNDGLEVGERQVRGNEVGHAPDDVKGEAVIAVVRNKTLRRFYDPTVAKLETGDQVVVVRHAEAETAEGGQPTSRSVAGRAAATTGEGSRAALDWRSRRREVAVGDD